MIRPAPVFALVFLAAPALAAPTGHQQPTPATAQQPDADPAHRTDMDARIQAAQEDQSRAKMQKDLNERQKALDERQKVLDAKMKRTLGGICNGC